MVRHVAATVYDDMDDRTLRRCERLANVRRALAANLRFKSVRARVRIGLWRTRRIGEMWDL